MNLSIESYFQEFERQASTFYENNSRLDYLNLEFVQPVHRRTNFGLEYECFHGENVTRAFNVNNHSTNPNLLISDDLNLLKYNLQAFKDNHLVSTHLCIKRFREIKSEQERLERQISGIHTTINNLSKKVSQIGVTLQSHQPLTAVQVRQLVEEISKQPKIVEAEALKLTEELTRKVTQVERLIVRLEESMTL